MPASQKTFHASCSLSTESGLNDLSSRLSKDENGLCERCAPLDLDVLYADTVVPLFEPINWWGWGFEPVIDLGFLNPDCRLCRIFAHCASAAKLDRDGLESESYQLLKCSTDLVFDADRLRKMKVPHQRICWRCVLVIGKLSTSRHVRITSLIEAS